VTLLAVPVLAASPSGSGGGLLGLLPLIVLGIAGYLLLSRSSRKRREAASAVQSSVDIGAQVMTTAGLFARVRALEDDGDIVLLEIAPGVVCRYAKASIARVIVPAEVVPDEVVSERLSPADDEAPSQPDGVGGVRLDKERGDTAA